MPKQKNNILKVPCGEHFASIEEIVAFSNGNKKLVLNRSQGFIKKIEDGHSFVLNALKDGQDIYGVTTGYGDSCLNEIPSELTDKLPINLMNFHGCGLGQHFSPVITRTILATRLYSLAAGNSGVRFALLEELEFLLHHDILPLIPEEGSVGASGDLTPLSYIARTLVGNEKVLYKGQIQPVSEVFEKLGHKTLKLQARETLAIMNGTSVMTAIACLAHQKAAYLTKLCSRITAMACLALKGNPYHFEEALFEVKPHPGQKQVASWIREDLRLFTKPHARLQDRYSLRCAPHIIGVLQDALSLFRGMIEIEVNSANDNPVVNAQENKIMHGGHFYGGHIAFAMDSLKAAIANLADMLDRQMALLVDEKFNNGLPANLSGCSTNEKAINHGLKALQISISAWTAEALKLTMPASVFSRSTECHNQDKVSMGTIAARDCLRILQLTEQVAAGLLIATTQALDLRINAGELTNEQIIPSIQLMKEEIRQTSSHVSTDRPLEADLRNLLKLIDEQRFELYA